MNHVKERKLISILGQIGLISNQNHQKEISLKAIREQALLYFKTQVKFTSRYPFITVRLPKSNNRPNNSRPASQRVSCNIVLLQKKNGSVHPLYESLHKRLLHFIAENVRLFSGQNSMLNPISLLDSIKTRRKKNNPGSLWVEQRQAGCQTSSISFCFKNMTHFFSPTPCTFRLLSPGTFPCFHRTEV